MLTTFKTQDEFLSALSEQMDKANAAGDQRSALLAGLAKADDELRAATHTRGSAALNLKVGSWVIRDADLPLIAAVSATGTAVAATLATAGIAWPLIAAALTSLADVCWKAWRKGARLSEPQVRVYGLLQSSGPLSKDGLAELLDHLGDKMELVALTATLNSLTEVELSDGDIISLAREDNGGFWRAVRI